MRAARGSGGVPPRARRGAAPTLPLGAGTPARGPRRTPKANVRRAVPAGEQARRRAAWRRVLTGMLLLVLAGGAGTGMVWGTATLKARGHLRVRHIVFEGQARIPESQLLGRLALPPHADLPDVDLGAVATAVLSHPWVRRVAVRRDYPDALRIRVWERTPVAVVAGAAGAAGLMVDAEGVILGPPPDAGAADAGDAAELPRLTGIDVRGRTAGDRVDPARVVLGARVAQAWGAPGALVDVADPDDPLLLADGLRVRLGAGGGYDWRLGRLAALKTQIAALAGKHGAEVDLRYNDRVIARPL